MTTINFEVVSSYLKKQSNKRIQKIIDGLYDLMDARDFNREAKRGNGWFLTTPQGTKATKNKMTSKKS